MSPAFVLEPTYNALRRRLINGEWIAGHRLEALKLAEDLGVSMTPVRDSLHRLVGERLVDGHSGQGFQVPKLDETELGELYRWRATLLQIACDRLRVLPGPTSDVPDFVAETIDLAPLIFDGVSMLTDSRELTSAVQNASARLGRFRLAERQAFADTGPEIERLKSAWRRGSKASLNTAIAAYHERRIGAAAVILQVGNLPRSQHLP